MRRMARITISLVGMVLFANVCLGAGPRRPILPPQLWALDESSLLLFQNSELSMIDLRLGIIRKVADGIHRAAANTSQRLVLTTRRGPGGMSICTLYRWSSAGLDRIVSVPTGVVITDVVEYCRSGPPFVILWHARIEKKLSNPMIFSAASALLVHDGVIWTDPIPVVSGIAAMIRSGGIIFSGEGPSACAFSGEVTPLVTSVLPDVAVDEFWGEFVTVSKEGRVTVYGITGPASSGPVAFAKDGRRLLAKICRPGNGPVATPEDIEYVEHLAASSRSRIRGKGLKSNDFGKDGTISARPHERAQRNKLSSLRITGDATGKVCSKAGVTTRSVSAAPHPKTATRTEGNLSETSQQWAVCGYYILDIDSGRSSPCKYIDKNAEVIVVNDNLSAAIVREDDKVYLVRDGGFRQLLHGLHEPRTLTGIPLGKKFILTNASTVWFIKQDGSKIGKRSLRR